MTSKKAPTSEELLAQFDDLSAQDKISASSESSESKTSKALNTPSDDPLAELEDMAKASSRSHTPKLGTTSTRSKPVVVTPPSTESARTSEEKQQELSTTLKAGTGTSADSSNPQDGTSAPGRIVEKQDTSQSDNGLQEQNNPPGGGWWGGILSTASAAVKQAEAAVKEIQKNEEAQKWAEQVKGNVGVLRDLGGELRSRAMPTFSNLLHTIAPPISRHERLQIHITHDFVGYPSLDPMIYQTFSRVMAQVEGGDLLVIQRGSESTQKRTADSTSGGSGWSDGPWWRQTDSKRDIGAVKGLVEGTKLVRANVEAYATDFFAPRGGVEEAAKQATTVLNEESPVRSSDIFLAIQAIEHATEENLFQGGPEEKFSSVNVDQPKDSDQIVSFAIYLHDPIHGLSFKTLSQSVPQRWINWLDAQPFANGSGTNQLPEEIQEIINEGGIDPRDWVSEWLEETLTLGVGVVAQRYVARRMGVGEGGLGRGKTVEHAIESGAGEAARVL